MKVFLELEVDISKEEIGEDKMPDLIQSLQNAVDSTILLTGDTEEINVHVMNVHIYEKA